MFRQKIALCWKTQGAISGQVWATGAAERMKNDPRRPVLVANLRFEGSSDVFRVIVMQVFRTFKKSLAGSLTILLKSEGNLSIIFSSVY